MTYLLTVAYLAVDYLQPGIKFPALAPFRLALVVGGLLIFSGLMKLVADRGRSMVFPRQSKLMLALLAVMAASIVTAIIRWQVLEAVGVMVQTFLVYFVMTQAVDSPRRLKGILWVLLGIHVWIAIDGITHFYSPLGKEGATRLTGVLAKFLGNNNDLCMALVIVLPFAYFLFLSTRSWFVRLLLVGAIVTFGIGIMSTLSRGGLIGLLAVAAVIAVRSKRRTPALAVLATLGLVFFILAPGAYWERMGTIADYSEDDSARSRYYTWRAGAEMALRNPVLGVGAGNFVTAYRIRYHATRPENTTGVLTAHSVYFEVLGELGFTGFGLFLAMIVANFRTCARLRRRGAAAGDDRDVIATAAAACEGGLVGFLTSAAFISAFYYPLFWYLTALIVIADRLAQEAASEAPAPAPAPVRPAFALWGAFRST